MLASLDQRGNGLALVRCKRRDVDELGNPRIIAGFSDRDALAGMAHQHHWAVGLPDDLAGRGHAARQVQGEDPAPGAPVPPILSKLMPWVLGNIWPNAARGERLMLGEVIPPGDER